MSINNDYITLALYKDRAQELQRKAANDRLVRLATRKGRRRRQESPGKGHRESPAELSVPRQRSVTSSASSSTPARVG